MARTVGCRLGHAGDGMEDALEAVGHWIYQLAGIHRFEGWRIDCSMQASCCGAAGWPDYAGRFRAGWSNTPDACPRDFLRMDAAELRLSMRHAGGTDARSNWHYARTLAAFGTPGRRFDKSTTPTRRKVSLGSSG